MNKTAIFERFCKCLIDDVCRSFTSDCADLRTGCNPKYCFYHTCATEDRCTNPQEYYYTFVLSYFSMIVVLLLLLILKSFALWMWTSSKGGNGPKPQQVMPISDNSDKPEKPRPQRDASQSRMLHASIAEIQSSPKKTETSRLDCLVQRLPSSGQTTNITKKSVNIRVDQRIASPNLGQKYICESDIIIAKNEENDES